MPGYGDFYSGSSIEIPATACYLPAEEELYNINQHENNILDIRMLVYFAMDKKSQLFNSILYSTFIYSFRIFLP